MTASNRTSRACNRPAVFPTEALDMAQFEQYAGSISAALCSIKPSQAEARLDEKLAKRTIFGLAHSLLKRWPW